MGAGKTHEASKATKAGRSDGTISGRLSSVPARPGVYIFRDRKEKVLYVGKAKSLRSRLRSYFQKSASLDARRAAMVEKVADFSYVVTDNELEALALEANLIKQYKPRFNVVLRDDKNYPYIRLSINEEWPRLEVVRRIKDDGAAYFGPYVPAGGMWEAISFIRRNFGIRPCKYSLDRPMRPCVQHQIGRCPAPCAGLVSRRDYLRTIGEVLLFLTGRQQQLVEELEGRMKALSGQTRYEEAAELRDRLATIKRATQSQKVVAPELGDVDVIGFHLGEDDAVFQVFFIRGGAMIGARNFYLKDTGVMTVRELVHSFIMMLYSKGIMPPPEIVAGARPSDPANLRAWLSSMAAPAAKGRPKGRARGRTVRITVPQEGKHLELLRMADNNARLLYQGRKGGGDEAVLGELGRRAGLGWPPRSIGAFDVSNLSGSEPVGAFVYWADGQFMKERYRRMKIKTVAGVDDYAMIRETVRRVFDDEEPPDLVVIDGGRGHLEAALSAVGRGVNVVSVAKKPDRLFLPSTEDPIALDDRSASSVLLRRIRDEVHRFAISYHKKLRGKSAVRSPLDGVPGIGPKRRLALLRRFGSLGAVREATVEDLAAVPGMDRRAAEAVKKLL